MKYDIRIEQIPPGRRLAVVQRRASAADLSRVVPQCCGIVWDAIRARSIIGAGRHVAIYLDCQINLEVGVELPAEFTGGDDVICSEIPSGTVATATYFGPYGGLGDAHQAIRDWCKTNGRTPAGPTWEIYGHWDRASNFDPSKIRTDVYHLISTDDRP